MFVQLLLVIVLLTYFAEKCEANLVFSLYAICSTLKNFPANYPYFEKQKSMCHHITKYYKGESDKV